MLRTNIKLGLLGALVGLLCSCGSSSSDGLEGSVEYIPVQLREGKSWSFIDSKGKLYAEDEFKNQPTCVVNGMFSVEEGNSYSLYNIKDLKNEVLSGLVAVGAYNEGVIPVTQKGERITLVDNKGKVKATLEPVDGKEITLCSSYVEDGMLLIANEDGKGGYADASGKVTIKPQYDDAFPFADGVALVVKAAENEDSKPTISVIDKSGKVLFKLKEEYSPRAYQFSDGHLSVKDTDKEVWGFINKKGEFTKVSSKVDFLGNHNSKYFEFANSDGEWGIMDMKGETIIKAKYSSIDILPDGTFLAQKGDDDKTKAYIIDKNGEKKVEFDGYKRVSSIVGIGDFKFLGKNKKYCLLNAKGEQIGEETFADCAFGAAHGQFITTDYFNPESVANAMTENLVMGGIGKFVIGTPVSSLGITDYEPYVWSTRLDADELGKEGFRFTTSVTASTDEIIARRDGEYDAFYNWNSFVVANPDAKIDRVSITANAQKPCWKEVKDALVAKIKEKGYTQGQDSDDSINFTGKNCNLSLNSDDDGSIITITISAPSNEPKVTEVAIVEDTEEVDW